MMRDDFCVFILTHGRPDRVKTYDTLQDFGYTGKTFIVIDDEDSAEDGYRAKFGNKVLQFSKEEISKRIDEGDNFKDRRCILYARNACFDLAKQVGAKYFVELDDDYSHFYYRFNDKKQYCEVDIKALDVVFSSLLDFFVNSKASSVCIAQTGDFVGGTNGTHASKIYCLRKAMNFFICDVDKPFLFAGRLNEDVNVYTALQRAGDMFLTPNIVLLKQRATQQNAGGMTDIYLEQGTYVKSFYTVMYAPSCTKVSYLSGQCKRLHHHINWDAAAPKIMCETYRKAAP